MQPCTVIALARCLSMRFRIARARTKFVLMKWSLVSTDSTPGPFTYSRARCSHCFMAALLPRMRCISAVNFSCATDLMSMPQILFAFSGPYFLPAPQPPAPPRARMVVSAVLTIPHSDLKRHSSLL